MKYLITGSGGFIGGHLLRALQGQGHEVQGFDLKDRSGDVRDYENTLRAMEGADGVFHLAAIASVQASIGDPEGTQLTNAQGARNVFEAAKALGGLPVVYASSAAVYGDNQNLPLSETEDPRPLSPYAEHKLQNERDARESGLKTFGLRFFNVYGPGQDPSSPYSGVISVFHDRLKAGRGLDIFGDGAQTRDFVAVEDVVRALMLAMEHVSVAAPVANVCTGQRSSLVELAQVLGDLTGHLPALNYLPAREGDIRHSCGNPGLFEKFCGFRPQTSLREGLRRLGG
jgi:UDP-glucose 4-epimerase